MKILVTGSTGFVGKTLCARLQAEGHQLVCLSSRNCDLTDPSSLAQFSGTTYDQVFHLAAWTRAGDFALYHPGEQWIINQQINTNVLRWWHQEQPQAKMICLGSSCAYDPNLPLAEENYLVGTPIESLFTYAMTKRMLYAGLLALNQQYDLKYVHIVPSTLYGPGYHTDGRQMHFIYDLIRKIVRAKMHGEPAVLWGDGHQKRELMFIDDFVQLTIRLNDKLENESVNIGAGEEFSIRYFAKAICDKVGYPFDAVQFDPRRYVGAKSKCLEVKKLERLVPAFPLTPLDRGLQETIDWFIKEDTRGAAPP